MLALTAVSLSTKSWRGVYWRPKFIRDIVKVEQLQRRASKFILHDFSSNYKTRLLSLDLLPLMMMFELNDVLFFINCLKNPSESFDIFKYVSFGTSSTRSGSHKLRHKGSLSKAFLFSSIDKIVEFFAHCGFVPFRSCY